MANVPPPPPPAAPVPFALAPGLAQDAVIDYNTRHGQRLFDAAVAPLEPLHDLKPENLRHFTTQFGNRAQLNNWHETNLTIPVNINQPNGDTLNLLNNYGELSQAQVNAHAATYVGQESRAAQSSYQIFHCVMNSLTTEARGIVTLRQEDYVVNNIPAGVPLLKVVIHLSHIDTNATTRLLRERLSSLDVYIMQIDSNIELLNYHVELQVEALAARGETTADLLTNLFKGYKQASDQKFVKYIEKKEEEYDEGTDMEPQELMELALNKYKTRVEKGEWNTPSESEEKIIALEAEVKKLRQDVKSKGKKQPPGKKGSGGNGKGKGTSKKGKPDWMTTPPKAGEAEVKTVDEKTYYWCKKHVAWVRHKPSDCKGKGYVPNKKSNAKGSDDSQDNSEKKLRMGKALAAIAEDLDEDVDSDEESL